LTRLRALTKEAGILLIFDEVVTGLRVAPGGAQSVYGIAPDLTTLAKIVAGGLPGGAVIGRKEILDLLDFTAMAEQGREKIGHPGTFNANPLSAAAGIATLDIVATGEPCARANRYGETLRRRLNEMFEAEGVDWAAYGTFATFHIFTNPEGAAITPSRFDPHRHSFAALKGNRHSGLVHKLRLAALVNGVDLSGSPGGVISATHGEAELEDTVEGLRRSVRMLRQEGEM
jgi:glutamate-1-semialdehyde 2,1-aminomutase